MSSDTARENASVVDSSATEWKNDVGNSDDPENEDGYPFRAQEPQHSHMVDKRGRLYNTRYFIIKSLNHQNIQLSIDKGIWATQLMNEPILEEAFHNSGIVILVFSVNMSGFFQGYAQMMSSVGWRRDNVWSKGSGKGNPWGRSFKVKWLCLNHLPFQKTLHLKNPLNDYKPVKISRDCQELPQDIGEALCELLDGSNDVDGSLKRDELPSKRPCIEPPYSLGDEDYNVPPLHMSWAGTPMPYHPFPYRHQADLSRFHLTHPHTLATEYFPTTTGASKVAKSPHASTLTEDDFLEMRILSLWSYKCDSSEKLDLSETYEEYLEAHGRTSKQLCRSVTAPSWTMQESTSRKHADDSSSSLVTDRHHSRKRTHNSS
ncbi:YTH family protein, putative isoform 1 [Theobroma cacao]|uniref:YTH domain-containing family protein n=1 Tax=Theobroma cacao TaxID=3641 RepID=A0A061GBY6_THECC|nr:YTH family protein, putative isoform 1 [Theobroma cacao]